uniref:Hypothetical chloroplast RF66 n=1 Tax=Notoscyphus lutescens TaxID=399523 RepID=A0A8F3BE18_9MARC|nr:hypothetical chloroplast RF66 [Notoscyphus lutescens]
MNHMELGPSTVIGITLVMVGIFLYALGKREPYVSRDYDFLFSSIGLLCGGILFFQGWRLDPILLLSQILLSGTTVFLIAENLYLRNSSRYLKYVKKIEINSRIGERYTYKNIRLEKNYCINGNDFAKISYTKHLSYCSEPQNKKALNYL